MLVQSAKMGGWLSNCAFVLSSFVSNLISMMPCVCVCSMTYCLLDCLEEMPFGSFHVNSIRGPV